MLLLVAVVIVNDSKQPIVQRVVYSSEDLIVVRKALQHVFLQREQIPVSTRELAVDLSAFTKLERFHHGAVLTYAQPILLPALYDGLVVFTGHTKYTGKTMTVLYNEGTTITYGFLDELTHLPYTPLRAGQSIGNQQNSLYIQMEQNGEIMNLEELLTWLKEYRL